MANTDGDAEDVSNDGEASMEKNHRKGFWNNRIQAVTWYLPVSSLLSSPLRPSFEIVYIHYCFYIDPWMLKIIEANPAMNTTYTNDSACLEESAHNAPPTTFTIHIAIRTFQLARRSSVASSRSVTGLVYFSNTSISRRHFRCKASSLVTTIAPTSRSRVYDRVV